MYTYIYIYIATDSEQLQAVLHNVCKVHLIQNEVTQLHTLITIPITFKATPYNTPM